MENAQKIIPDVVQSAGQIFSTQSTYRGQAVTVIPDSTPSIVQLASTIAGFEATKQKLRPRILEQQIFSKKVFKEKEKILSTYAGRLGQQKQTKRYKDIYNELNRSKYKEEYKEQPNQLSDVILYKIAESFGEVTEQDNIIEYTLATNEIDQANISIEIIQVKKMIEFFSNPEVNIINIGFANSEKIKWSNKLIALEEDLNANVLFREQLLRAQESLRKIHKQEIRDGYNLIPKAAAVLEQYENQSEEDAVSFAVAYRDEVLTMKNPLDVFEVFIHRQEKKREEFRPYIDSMIALFGYDMSSSNPSRSKEELYVIRDGLFKIEICGQIYDSVGALSLDIKRIFKFMQQEKITQKEQLTATRELVKLTQSAFASSQQIVTLLNMFSENCSKYLELSIFVLNQAIELVRNLPEKFFKDDQSQFQFIVTAQKKLDEFILQEEESAAENYISGGN